MKIMVDINGTLINNPQSKSIIQLVKALSSDDKFGNKVYAWSNIGSDYAKSVCIELGIYSFMDGFCSKEDDVGDIDLTIDDEVLEVGKFNLKV